MGSSDAAAAQGAGESAINRALEQVRQNPSDHRAFQQLSAAYAKDRQADDLALAAALQAITLEPKAPEAYLQAAAVYGHWNQPERSKEILLRCIEHCPSSHDANLMLAKVYRQLHELDHCDEAIERCLELQPGSPAALNERAAKMLRDCRPSAYRRVFAGADAGAELPDQLAVAADPAKLPAQWPRLAIGPLWVAHHPRLPRQHARSTDGSAEVVLLGTLIDPQRRQLNRFDWQPPGKGLFPALERRLNTMAGRFVCLAREGRRLRLYLDASGSLSMLFSAEHGMAASTVALFPKGGEADDNCDLITTLDVGRRNRFFPFGLTPRHSIQRILPNHVLNLDTWKVHRWWPTAAITQAAAPEEALHEIAGLLRGTVLSLIEAGHRPYLSLTAGYDSRTLLALLREERDAIDWFTWDLPDANAARDVQIAHQLARDLGLNHRVIPFTAASAHEQALWQHRCGLAVGELRGMSLASTVAAMGDSCYYLSAVGLELGRLFPTPCRWREVGNATTALSAAELLRRMKLPQEASLLAAARRWRRQLEPVDSLQVLDLWYLEQRLGCWAGVTAYGDATGPIRLHPFNGRIVELLMGLPAVMRMEDRVPKALIHRWWPELFAYPFNGSSTRQPSSNS